MDAVAVSLDELKEEIKDMLAVCFEGSVINVGRQICLTLPNGQKFSVSVVKEAA